MSSDEQAEMLMLQQLHRLVSAGPTGWKDDGSKMTQAEWERAVGLYEGLKARKEARDMERARLALEVEKAQAQVSIEQRRLDLEQERIQVQKAEVVVRALEVAVQGGVAPDQLLAAINSFSERLLSGPSADRALETLRLTDKK